MDDELDAFGGGDTDLEESPSGVSGDEGDEIEHSDRVAVGVEHVVVD